VLLHSPPQSLDNAVEFACFGKITPRQVMKLLWNLTIIEANRNRMDRIWRHLFKGIER
jgi:hypothetical protein